MWFNEEIDILRFSDAINCVAQEDILVIWNIEGIPFKVSNLCNLHTYTWIVRMMDRKLQ